MIDAKLSADLSTARGTLAVIFPGQGSQVGGMGRQLIQNYPAAQLRLEEFSNAVDVDLNNVLCGDFVTNDPVWVHLAMVSFGIIAWEWLTQVAGYEPDMVAGHSLGEITALSCAGVVDPVTAIRLAQQRGLLIAEACKESQGGMKAFVGAPLADICALFNQWKESFTTAISAWEANYNGPEQLVIAGELNTIQVFEEGLSSTGISAVTLATAGAFHTPFMNTAAEKLAAFAESITFHPAHIPLISSLTGRQLTSSQGLGVHLALQLVSPVLWLPAMQCMQRAQITKLIEVIPQGGVLSQLAASCKDWPVTTTRICDLFEESSSVS